jgi:hypothetical protein
MEKKHTHEVSSDLPIIDVHILTLNILSATILFLLLRFNKNFKDHHLRTVITIISILFCFAAFTSSFYAVLAAFRHRKKTLVYKDGDNLFSMDRILDRIPIIMSVVLLIISILLLYTVAGSTIQLFFKNIM